MKVNRITTAHTVGLDRRLKQGVPGRRERIRRMQRTALLTALPFLGYATDGYANNDIYTGTTGNWSDGTKWSLNTKPVPGDSVLLAPASGAVVVTLDVSATNLSQLTLDATNGSSVTLLQSANVLSVNGDETIGLSGSGTFNQSGGTHTISSGSLNVGSGGTGAYLMSNGVLALTSSSEYIGANAAGTFTQSGGTHTVSGGLLDIGGNSNGNYNLAGGTLALTNNAFEFIGDFNAGSLNQTGGIHSLSGGSLILGYFPSSVGTYAMANGTLALTSNGTNSVSEYIGYFGKGVFNQSGGSHQIAASGTGSLYLGYSADSIGIYNLMAGTASAAVINVGGAEGTSSGGVGILNISGGSLSISQTLHSYNTSTGTNHSAITQTGGILSGPKDSFLDAPFTQSGGTATFGTVSGVGDFTVGGGTASAQTTIGIFTLKAVAINGNGTLTAAANSTNVNSINALTITSTGLLDLQNRKLLIDNSATPFAKVHQYIDAGYNRNVATGFGDYNGRGGISSSVVKANADFMSVGYYNGALQDPTNPDNVGQILGPNSNSGHGSGIPLSQILVRPTLTGDLNGDGVVNSYDVSLFNSFGLYNQATTLGYQAGDLNGDGVVDSKDVNIFNTAGNFNNGSYLVVTAAAKAAMTLTGHSASPATAVLNPDPGTLAFVYDPITGDVKVKYNGFTGFAGKQAFNTTTRALSLIDIATTGGAFALDPSKLTQAVKTALSGVTITGNTEINLTAVNGYLPDGTDLGMILPPNLDPAALANALTLTFNYTGSRQLAGGVAGLIVPEPTTLSLLGLGAMGLLARRRRNDLQKMLVEVFVHSE